MDVTRKRKRESRKRKMKEKKRIIGVTITGLVTRVITGYGHAHAQTSRSDTILKDERSFKTKGRVW